MTHPLLPLIPDDLLRRTGQGDTVRARRLLAWLENRSFRPTLADLEDERARRGHTPPAAPATGHTEGRTTR